MLRSEKNTQLTFCRFKQFILLHYYSFQNTFISSQRRKERKGTIVIQNDKMNIITEQKPFFVKALRSLRSA